MGAPRIDQVNIVVGDVEGAARFLSDLGVDVPATDDGFQAHHRSVPTSTSLHGRHDLPKPEFGIDLDSGAFAQMWGGVSASFIGVVVDVRVDERADVDRLHDLAVSVGGRSLKAPYDAFWGSRFAVVEGPGPLTVGLMSVPDPAQRSSSPDPSTFG